MPSTASVFVEVVYDREKQPHCDVELRVSMALVVITGFGLS